MHYSQMKIAFEAMEGQMRDAAAGTRLQYFLPMVIVTVSDLGIGVSVGLGDLERKADRLQSFDAAIIEAQAMTRWVCAQMNGDALARTLGLEVEHA